MTWNNASLDQLPADKAEVIISVNGVNHLSVFSARSSSFRTKSGLTSLTYKTAEHIIYWKEPKEK